MSLLEQMCDKVCRKTERIHLGSSAMWRSRGSRRNVCQEQMSLLLGSSREQDSRKGPNSVTSEHETFLSRLLELAGALREADYTVFVILHHSWPVGV